MSDHGADPYAAPDVEQRESRTIWGAVVAVLAATVLLVGVLTALSGEDSTKVEDPFALLSSAPDAVKEARTARVVIEMDVEGGMSMNMSGEGLVDFESGDSSMSMSMFGTEMEMRSVDQHIYVRIPGVTGSGGLTTSWIGMPVSAAGPSGASATGSPNAAGMIDSLRGVSNDIEELGRQEINGQDGNGFRVTIDLARATEEVPEADRQRMEESLAQMRAMGMSEMPMEVWVNDEGLPLRMVMELDDVGGAGAGMRMQMDYLDFGLPVDITPPPADDTTVVQDTAELQQLMGGVVTETGEATSEEAAA